MSILHGLLDGMLQGMNGILGGGSSNFTPSSISGLTLWLDPSDATTLTIISNKVAQINDKSPSGNNFSQAVTRPAPSTINGLGSINYTLANPLVGSALALTAAEGFIVNKATTVVTNGLWAFGSPGDGGYYPFSSTDVYDSFGSTARMLVGTPTPNANILATVNILNVISTSAEWTAKINDGGAASFTTATNTVGWRASSYIGSNNFNRAFDGDIGEVLIYDHKLSAIDHAKVYSYLKAKWGIV